MPVLLAPVARRDWTGAAWAAGLGGVMAWGMAAAVVIKMRELPLSIFGFASYYPQFSGLSLIDELSLAIPLAAGIAAGVGLGWLVASEARKPEVAGDGGQLRNGASAARGEINREAALSDVLFTCAGIKFTADRVRRSFVILGSIGGGKTQVIWQLLQGLRAADYRVLLIDGPKGDYSSCTPSNPLIISPWSTGPAWDIAADCHTRGHARELAAALIPISEKDPIWGNAAGMIFIAILCKLQADKGTAWGWSDIYDHITLPVDALREIAAQHYPPAVQVLADAESKTTQSVLINLTAFMSDVFEMSLAWRNTKNRFSFTRWWRGEHDAKVVILQGSGEFKSLAGGYISSIVNTLANLTASPSFAESKTRRHAIIIDEMAQLPRLAGVEKFLEIGRSKGCSAIFATQSPSQLRKVYGQDDLSSWLAMIGTKIFVRVVGADDSEVALRELGEREVYLPTTSSTSSGAGAAAGQSVTQGWQRETVAVVRAEQLKELGPCRSGIAAILEGIGKDPIRVVFPFFDAVPVRPVFAENPDFNRPISQIENTQEKIEIVQCDGVEESEPLPTETSSLSEPILLAAPQAVYVIEAEAQAVADPADPAEPEGEGDEVGGKIMDELADPIAEAVLSGAGAHLLQLAQELQEVVASDIAAPAAAPIFRKKTLRKKRESEVHEHA